MEQTNVLAVFLIFVVLVQQCSGQITFTGYADNDFNIPVGDPRARTLLTTLNTDPVAVSDWMNDHGLLTGWDLAALSVQYDYLSDSLFVGLDCWVICGDADGDGNPDSSTDHGNKDNNGNYGPVHPEYDQPLQGGTEYTTLTLWTNPPANYTPDLFNNYRPDLIVGDSSFSTGTLDRFNSYVFDYETYCATASPTACSNRIKSMARTPHAYINEAFPISKLSALNAYNGKTGIEDIKLHHYPNATKPDIEFTIAEFSRYGSFNFTPGIDPIVFAYSVVLGSGNDACGEEVQYPKILKIPCLIFDACGVCGGNNSTCTDCFGIPNGLNRYDACGVCAGDNSSCWDCFHIPHGSAKYDACGVCGGNNQTCWDCKHIPNGPNRYDACGICAGDNSSCWDCFHIPHGQSTYDACGVCGGDGSSCWDCFHISNGPNTYDACGVCAGDNTTCWDCLQIPNGPNRYDACGVCAGDGSSCWDCFHISNGQSVYDQCGICGGDGLSCLDCNGVIFGNLIYDACGVCGGDNATCLDCLGIPNGPNHLDDDNVTCDCFYKDTFVFYPDDTWIGTCDREQNHEYEDKLWVRHSPKARSLLEWFDIRQTILQAHRNFTKEHTYILNAKMYLQLNQVGGGWEIDDPELAFHRIGRFVSKQATWECSEQICEGDNTDCCKQWRMIGLPPQVVPSYKAEPSILVNLTSGQFGTLEFDILNELTNYVYEEEDLYFAYLLKKVCEKGRGWANFFSSETGETLRPRIVVTFKTHCDIIVPVLPQPPCPDKEDDWDWDQEL